MEKVTLPQIYKLMPLVMHDLGAITKDQKNVAQGFLYRGIDQVLNQLQPALVKNQVTLVTRSSQIVQTQQTNRNGTIMTRTVIYLQVWFYAPDGSSIECGGYGEALDSSDKSVNKAETAAFKYIVFKALCVPVKGVYEDADKDTQEIVDPAVVKVATANDVESLLASVHTKVDFEAVKPKIRALNLQGEEHKTAVKLVLAKQKQLAA